MDTILVLLLILVTIVNGMSYIDDSPYIRSSRPYYDRYGNYQRHCTIVTEEEESNKCIGEIACTVTTTDIKHTLREWECINPEADYINHFNQSFELTLYLRDGTLADLLSGMDKDIVEHVKNLTVADARAVGLEQFLKLTGLQKVSLRGSLIGNFSLDQFTPLPNLKELIIENMILSMSDDSNKTQITKSGANIMSLSNNNLNKLPQNFFVNFPELLRLDLSKNNLEILDILTFEGLTKLQFLDLSNNRIKEIGQAFARFINMLELSLENNQIDSLSVHNFETMSKLEKLDLSENMLTTIPDDVFKNLISLTQLDIRVNNIKAISKELFVNNNNLHVLLISHNDIKTLEPGTFRGKNITTLERDNNTISFQGMIDKYTFDGIFVSELDLSCGEITELGAETFSGMGPVLQNLNVSFNQILRVSSAAFNSLEALKTLDLSHNMVEELSFNTKDLIQLTDFYAQNNSIKSIRKETFKNLKSLTILCLSSNAITEIEDNSFENLNDLEYINLSNNSLGKTISESTFKGLKSVISLDMIETAVTLFQNNSFSGMNSLNALNASHGKISNIEYNAFRDTGSLREVDLSFNSLNSFHVNTSTILTVYFIHLQYNQIEFISNDTFKNLAELVDIDLIGNKIHKIDSFPFNNLINIRKIYIGSTTDMEAQGTIFEGLHLNEIVLRNVNSNFTFNNVQSTSTTLLDMSNCNIIDIEVLFIWKVQNVEELILSGNNITALSKTNFQNMKQLQRLDLSSNLIAVIQPGTFLNAPNLINLNLHNNKMQALKYGIFEGLSSLNKLNLSKNLIHDITITDFRNTPALRTVILDDNKITYLQKRFFYASEIHTLSIGGNQIPCKDILEFVDSYSFGNLLTAENPDYHSENVDGIACSMAGIASDDSSSSSSSIGTLTGTLSRIGNILENMLSAKYWNGTNDKENDTTLQNKIKSIMNTEKVDIIEEVSNKTHNTGQENLSGVLHFISVCLAIIIVLYIGNVVYTNFGNRIRLILRRRGCYGSTQPLTSLENSNSYEIE